MSRRGKSITMFLMDGDASGRIKASISNWIGLGYKIPRDRLQECNEVNELTQSSVYFLFGQSTSGKNPVYIGQAGIRKNGKGILSRLMEHDANPDKNYWTEAVVFTTSNNSFGPTELSFLENRFCNMAIKAGRYEVKNAVDPTPGNITEEKESELDEYADYAELILGVLGYKVFEPYIEPVVEKTKAKMPVAPKKTKPDLPPSDLKVGEYVRTAMRNLCDSGFEFTKTELNEMCSSEWSVEHFHMRYPFLQRVDEIDAEEKKRRYWNEEFILSGVRVYITKEWHSNHKELFITWYNTL